MEEVQRYLLTSTSTPLAKCLVRSDRAVGQSTTGNATFRRLGAGVGVLPSASRKIYVIRSFKLRLSKAAFTFKALKRSAGNSTVVFI